MINVKDLAKKLRHYAQQSPDHANSEVMIAFESGLAFPFHGGDEHTAMSTNATVKKFLVMTPDLKGDRLILKGSERH